MSEDFNAPEHLDWERSQLESALSGDREAFAALYRAYARPIYARVLMPKLGESAAAQDALAETFRTAFERLHQYEQRGTSVYFWLVRIASNKALDLHRARGVTGRLIFNLEAQFHGATENEPSAHSLLELHERSARRRARLQLCLDALNPRYRQAIELRFLEEHERDACAQRMGTTTGAFDVLILRALRSLHKQWEQLVADAKEPISERY